MTSPTVPRAAAEFETSLAVPPTAYFAMAKYRPLFAVVRNRSPNERLRIHYVCAIGRRSKTHQAVVGCLQSFFVVASL